MPRFLFVLPDVDPEVDVRLDTDADDPTPAVVFGMGGGAAIPGAKLNAGADGSLPRVVTTDGTATLFVKTLDYTGVQVGDPVSVAGVDEDAAPSAASAVPVTAQAMFKDDTTPTTIPSGSILPLAWPDMMAGGDAAMMDFTNPLKPTFLRAGIYAVTATIVPVTSGQAGKSFYGELDMDADDEVNGNFWTTSTCALDRQGGVTAQMALTLTWYLPEGGSIQVNMKHDVGSDVDWWLEASVRQVG